MPEHDGGVDEFELVRHPISRGKKGTVLMGNTLSFTSGTSTSWIGFC